MPELEMFLPQTAGDIYSRAEDIRACLLAEPGVEPDADIIDWMAAHPHVIYLFYLDGSIMGFIRLDDRAVNPTLGKHTAEIHGAILPEYRGLVDLPAQLVMSAAFSRKKNILAKIDPENAGAIGFCRKWGFQRINLEHGKIVYRLKRSQFKRLEDVRREETPTG